MRKTGIEYLIDIHLQVEPELSVKSGHLIGHQVRDQLIAFFPHVRDVLVHLEPFDKSETLVSIASPSQHL